MNKTETEAERNVKSLANEDSDESDEDFDPTTDKDEENDPDDDLPNDVNDAEETNVQLSSSQNTEVNDAFDSLFGKSNEMLETTSLNEKGNQSKRSKLEKKKKKIALRKLQKRKRILTEIFGRTEASKMIKRHLKMKKNVDMNDIASIDKSLLCIPEKKTVTVVQKFAGNEVSIQKKILVTPSITNDQIIDNPTIVPGCSNDIKNTEKAKGPIVKKSGLDNILADLKGPQKISTVEKTSSDWETFKDNSGLEDEFEKLAQGGKDSYLSKKEFLQRVDLRRFEQEKAARDSKRAASGI